MLSNSAHRVRQGSVVPPNSGLIGKVGLTSHTGAQQIFAIRQRRDPTDKRLLDMNNRNGLTLVSLEIKSAMVAQFTSDIAARVDCKWVVAMDDPGFGLVPPYTFGRHSNLEACVAETTAVLSGQAGRH